MSYSVIPIEKFKKEAKRLVKKYPSLKKELIDLNTILISNPTVGISLGNNAYKISISIKSKGAGKSGGGRIIIPIIPLFSPKLFSMPKKPAQVGIIPSKIST